MNAVAIIAGRELRDGLRNRWVIATTLLMAALALTLTLLGSAPTGTVGVSALAATIVSLLESDNLSRPVDRPADLL